MTPIKVRALLVEDNPGDADLAREMLSRSRNVDFDITHVACLEKAIERLQQQQFDVVILDLNLPDSRDLETLRRIGSSHRRVPIVVVTGSPDDNLREDAIALGAEEVISKDGLGIPLFALSVLYVVERNRAREQQELLATILDATPDAVVVATAEGEVKYVNRQAESLFGKTREALEREQLLFAGEQNDATELRVFGTEEEKIGEMRVLALDWLGEPSYLASIRDVTQRKQLELQLLVSDRMVSLGTLAAGVAHEINNPLAVVIANTAIVLNELRPLLADVANHHGVMDAMRDIEDAGARIRRIVRDLKMFSRSDEDERDMHDVRGVLDSVARMAWNEIRHRARLFKEYGDVPEVCVNESRLSQVFLNLLVNAAQAIGEGKGETAGEIRIRTGLMHDGRVKVEIQDDGPGIPPELQRRMFTPFFTTKPVGTGTGLGLVICQRIMNAMGGEISFESKVGEGTCFRVVLPRPTPDQARKKKPKAIEVPTANKKGRVLVIDDEKTILNTLTRLLSREHEVTGLGNGGAALELIDNGERFDVILCDLMMPEMSGVDLFHALHARVPDQAERMVFVTGGAFSSEASDFLQSTSNQQVQKPFDILALRRLVNELVQDRGANG